MDWTPDTDSVFQTIEHANSNAALLAKGLEVRQESIRSSRPGFDPREQRTHAYMYGREEMHIEWDWGV